MQTTESKTEGPEVVEVGAFARPDFEMHFDVPSFFDLVTVKVWNATTELDAMNSLREFFNGIKAGTIVLPEHEQESAEAAA